MKKIQLYVLFLFVLIGSINCIKNKLQTWTGVVTEIDAASWNANGPGVTYPFIVRIPVAGRAAATSCPDSTLRRYSGSFQIRINLVSAHSSKDETVGYEIFTKPVDSVAFPQTLGYSCAIPVPTSTCRQIPMMDGSPSGTFPAPPNSCVLNNARLAVFDAVAGTHYSALSGTVTIPKDSSFGYINIQILNPGISRNEARFLGIRLNSSGSIKPSQNYKEIGLFIDQR